MNSGIRTRNSWIFELVTRGFELVTRGLELVTRAFEFQLLTRNSYFTISPSFDCPFFYLQLFPISISWEFIQFSFSLVNFYHTRAINTLKIVLSICTENIALGHCTDLGRYLYLVQYFPVQIEKKIIALITNKVSFKEHVLNIFLASNQTLTPFNQALHFI